MKREITRLNAISRGVTLDTHPLPATTQPSEVDGTALVRFWGSLDQTDRVGYERAVEKYFVHPHILAIRKRVAALENKWRRQDLEALCEAQETGEPVVGYVYAARNPLFAHLRKIGATMRTPEIRLRELANAGVPEPFELVASLPSTNPFRLEREIHAHFATARTYGKKKEFFAVSSEEIIALFHTLTARAMAMPPKKRRATTA